MGSSSAQERSRLIFTDVFQHHADAHTVEHLRSAICDSVYHCITSRNAVYDFPGRNLLYYGSYNVRPTTSNSVRNCLNELVWKRSELTGKYIGCPYWSAGAKALFDAEVAKSIQGLVSLDDAWKIAHRLQKRGGTLKGSQLTHEHVFPRKSLVEILEQRAGSASREEVESLIEQLAVGCVVLESEHPQSPAEASICKYVGNPWLRYKEANIALVENPAWPLEHKKMIQDAGLG